METEEDSVLGQTRLLLRRVAPLGIVVLIAVSLGILLVLFVSWLGEVLLQVPLQDSVSAFIQNGILLSIAFALLGHVLSGRVLPPRVTSAVKTEHTPKVELAPQLDLRVKEPEKPPPKVGMLQRFRERLEAEEKREKRETHPWKDTMGISSHEASLRPKQPLSKIADIPHKSNIVLPAKPAELSKVEVTPPRIETAPTTSGQIVEVTESSAGPKEVIPGVPSDISERAPIFVPPGRLAFRVEEMSFNCSTCSKTANLPWEKVQQSRKGEQVTVDCPHCHNQYQFNYDLARGKLLSGKILVT